MGEGVRDQPQARPDFERVNVEELVQVIPHANNVDEFLVLNLKIIHRKVPGLLT